LPAFVLWAFGKCRAVAKSKAAILERERPAGDSQVPHRRLLAGESSKTPRHQGNFKASAPPAHHGATKTISDIQLSEVVKAWASVSPAKRREVLATVRRE